MSSHVAQWESARVVPYSAFAGGSTVTLGVALTSPMVVFKIINTTDVDVAIGLSSTATNDIVPAGSFLLYDLQTNDPDFASIYALGVGSQLYVRQVTGSPTKGIVALTGFSLGVA